MAKDAELERAKKTFADLTAALEDATILAAEGQAVRYSASARHICARLAEAINACHVQAQRLRRRLE